MMAHQFSIAYQGEKDAALRSAQQLMADRGFEVSKIGGGEVRGTRNHSLFTGKKTNDMLALVSELVIRASTNQLTAKAELGTLRKLVVFLIVLCVSIETIFLIAAVVVMQNSMMMIRISALTLGPWVIIVPGMLYAFRRQAFREIETLLKNAVTIGENG